MKRSATKTNRGGVNLGSAFFCIFFLVSGTVLLFSIYQALGEHEKRRGEEGVTSDYWERFEWVNEGGILRYSFSGREFEFVIVDSLGEVLKDEIGTWEISGEIVAKHSGRHHVSVRTLIPNESVEFSVYKIIIEKYSIWDILSSPSGLIFLIAGILAIVLGLLFLRSIRT